MGRTLDIVSYWSAVGELWAPAMALIGGVRERFGEVEACVMAPAPWDRVGGVRAGRLRRA